MGVEDRINLLNHYYLFFLHHLRRRFCFCSLATEFSLASILASDRIALNAEAKGYRIKVNGMVLRFK
jgi:hypothetical protein